MKLAPFAVALFFCLSAKAQSSLAIRGGVNLTSMSYSVDYSKVSLSDPNDPLIPSGASRWPVKAAIRPSFGVSYTAGITKSIGIQVDLLYQGQGYAGVNGDNTKLNLSYIMVPVSFLYRHKRMTLTAGNYASILVHPKPGNYMTGYDVGATAGIEFSVLSNVSIGAKYYQGLIDIYTKDYPANSKLRSGQLYVAYTLRSW